MCNIAHSCKGYCKVTRRWTVPILQFSIVLSACWMCYVLQQHMDAPHVDINRFIPEHDPVPPPSTLAPPFQDLLDAQLSAGRT